MSQKKLIIVAVIVIGVLWMLSALIPGTGKQAKYKTNQDGSHTRAEVYADIEATLGLVPTFFKNIPEDTLEMEWALMKKVQMEPGPIPNKYRELIGVAVSAATKCRYCSYFHSEMARLNGATEAEIQDALLYAKSTTGWSTYINGSQMELEQFKAEVSAIARYLRNQAAQGKK